MPIMNALKFSAAALFTVLGLFALYQMFTTEVNTGESYTYYFKWAFAAGLVFIAVAASLTALEKEDTVITEPDEKSSNR